MPTDFACRLVRRVAARSLPIASLAGLLATATAQCPVTWQPTALGAADEGLRAFATLRNGDLVAGGRFATIGGTAANYVARWNGSAWAPMGNQLNVFVYALTTLHDGTLVAGGSFFGVGGSGIGNCVARWDGSAWQPMGAGVGDPAPLFAPVRALAVLPNGDLVAGGDFATMGGVAASHVARWNGTAWSPLGTGTDGPVHALAVLPNGDLIVGGFFNVAGGVPTQRIARWDGTSWSPLGAGIGGFVVYALAAMADGSLIAGGQMQTAGAVQASNIARWDGSAWSALGSGCAGIVTALLPLPDGTLVVGGGFGAAGGVACSRIARWNGTAWSAVGAGTNGSVFALGVQADGAIAVGGDFATVDGVTNGRLARLRSSCSPSYSHYGSGCTGSGGAVSLTALAPPVLGAPFHARATGMPPLAVLGLLVGTSAVALPASLAHPAALPGCSLLVNPDIDLSLSLVPAGTIDIAVAIPSSTVFLGATAYLQAAAAQLDLVLGIVQIATSNGLAITVGSYGP